MFRFLNMKILSLPKDAWIFKWNEKLESCKRSVSVGGVLFQIYVI